MKGLILCILLLILITPSKILAFVQTWSGFLWEQRESYEVEYWLDGVNVDIHYDSPFGQHNTPAYLITGFYIHQSIEASWKWITITFTHPMYETIQVVKYFGQDEVYNGMETNVMLVSICSQEYPVKVIGPLYVDNDRIGSPYYLHRVYYYQSLQIAYNEADDGSLILLNADTVESLTLDLGKQIDIAGGYNCRFEDVIGQTKIENLLIESGNITIENIQIGD